MRRKRRNGMTTFKAGLIGLILIIVFTYLGFTKFANPFANPYTVHAIFANGNQLRPASFVRIAGINVGKVVSVKPVSSCAGQPKPCSGADVTMTIDQMGLPLHKDATFAIRPRIFLEGNFFVDIRPGSSAAPKAPSGYTFPIQNGVEPVQFDQVLTSLQSDTRHNLQILLKQYGIAVKKGGPAYNQSIQYWLPAYKYTAIVNHDFLGYQPHDLSNYIDRGGVVAEAIDRHPQNLKSLISDLNTTAHALAVQSGNLERTVKDLPPTLSTAIPTLHSLNAIICAGPEMPNCAPGRLPTLAKDLIPGVKSTNPMITAQLPLLNQLRLLMQPSELQGLSKDLAVAIPALAKLTIRSIPFFKNEVRPASSCVATKIIPWSHLTVPDKHFNASNGFPPRQVYVEAVDFLPGLAGESRNFDSDGPYIRVGSSAGASITYSLSNGLFGQALAPLLGAEPKPPPDFKRPLLAGGDAPNSPCETQPTITDLTANSSSGPQAVPPSNSNPVSSVTGTAGSVTGGGTPTTPTVPGVTVPTP